MPIKINRISFEGRTFEEWNRADLKRKCSMGAEGFWPKGPSGQEPGIGFVCVG